MSCIIFEMIVHLWWGMEAGAGRCSMWLAVWLASVGSEAGGGVWPVYARQLHSSHSRSTSLERGMPPPLPSSTEETHRDSLRKPRRGGVWRSDLGILRGGRGFPAIGFVGWWNLQQLGTGFNLPQQSTPPPGNPLSKGCHHPMPVDQVILFLGGV